MSSSPNSYGSVCVYQSVFLIPMFHVERSKYIHHQRFDVSKMYNCLAPRDLQDNPCWLKVTCGIFAPLGKKMNILIFLQDCVLFNENFHRFPAALPEGEETRSKLEKFVFFQFFLKVEENETKKNQFFIFLLKFCKKIP